jgi:hypothetical protein
MPRVTNEIHWETGNGNCQEWCDAGVARQQSLTTSEAELVTDVYSPLSD